MSLLCYTLFLFYKLLNMFRAQLRTPQWTHYLLTGFDSLPAATAQYQHVAITLRSSQLLYMSTWLPETCWATCEREIKYNTKVTSSWFLIHTSNLVWNSSDFAYDSLIKKKSLFSVQCLTNVVHCICNSLSICIVNK